MKRVTRSGLTRFHLSGPTGACLGRVGLSPPKDEESLRAELPVSSLRTRSLSGQSYPVSLRDEESLRAELPVLPRDEESLRAELPVFPRDEESLRAE